MATNGVKIMDSDLAMALYREILDLYDSGEDTAAIQEKIPFAVSHYPLYDDYDQEVRLTTYALAFWEIGSLTPEMFREVERVVALGASVQRWTTECGEREGRRRQRELDKLLETLARLNPKIRKRKKYRAVKPFFQPGELLAVRMSDRDFYAAICIEVIQYRGRCTYNLVPTTYRGSLKPTVDYVRGCAIYGTSILTSFSAQQILSEQPDVEVLWNYDDDSGYYFGACCACVEHKNLVSFKDRFEVVGKLKMKEGLKSVGSLTMLQSFEKLEIAFSSIEQDRSAFGDKKYPVDLVCEL